ncbi:MAG: hypothetical protein ACFB0C_04880 [Leptolyngbyaceae cyanobacterium]
MTVRAQELLSTFDDLPDSVQVEVALGILRRVIDWDFPPLTDDDLIFNAEALFLDLDQQKVEYE